ncbi:hypothetical protein J4Q44_G00045960, partial [Coregonus suidteri]
MVELPISPPVKPIVAELPISPPVKPIMVELPISPPVKPIMVELPISPPVKPIVAELPISPLVKPVMFELPISSPVKPVMFELPISSPVEPIVVERPISPVVAESLQRFEFAPPPRKNKPLKDLTQRHTKRQIDMETSVPQARPTPPPPCLSDYFPSPTPQRCQRNQDFFPPPPVKPIVVERPISPPVKPVMFELPIAPVVAESLQRFEKNKQLKGLKQQHKKRQKDMETSVPQTKTTPPPPWLSDYFPPPQGGQGA